MAHHPQGRGCYRSALPVLAAVAVVVGLRLVT